MSTYRSLDIKALLEIHQDTNKNRVSELDKDIQKNGKDTHIAFGIISTDSLDEILRKYRACENNPSFIELDNLQENVKKDKEISSHFMAKYEDDFQLETCKYDSISKWPLDLLAAQAYEHDLKANISLFSLQLKQAFEVAMWHSDSIFQDEIRLICYGIANAVIYKSIVPSEYVPKNDAQAVIDDIFQKSELTFFEPKEYKEAVETLERYFTYGINNKRITKIKVLAGNRTGLPPALKQIHKKLRSVNNIDKPFAQFIISTFSCYSNRDLESEDFTHSTIYKYSIRPFK